MPVVEVVEAEMPMRWDFHDLADRLGAVVQEGEDALRLEQAVYGLDSLDEVRLHQFLVRGLSRWYTVQREVGYPSMWGKKRNARQRCDLVVSPLGRPLKVGDELDLFTPADAVSAEDALWLEVKVAYQFRDVATTHGGYAGQWKTGVVEDLKKMAADKRIKEGGLLMIVFNESEEILAKDLELFEEHLTLQGFSGMGSGRHVRSVRITERMGHRLASLALWPVVQR